MGKRCPIFLGIFCAVAVGCVLAQVEIQENYDGTRTIATDPDAGSKEIYTSMHQLREFFNKEKEYVSDIRQMIEKKLVSLKAVGSLGMKMFTFFIQFSIVTFGYSQCHKSFLRKYIFFRSLTSNNQF